MSGAISLLSYKHPWRGQGQYKFFYSCVLESQLATDSMMPRLPWEAQLDENAPHFLKLDISLLCLQNSVNDTYLEPNESKVHSYVIFKIFYINVLSFSLALPNGIQQVFPQNFVCRWLLFLPLRAPTFLLHLPSFVHQTNVQQDYKL